MRRRGLPAISVVWPSVSPRWRGFGRGFGGTGPAPQCALGDAEHRPPARRTDALVVLDSGDVGFIAVAELALDVDQVVDLEQRCVLRLAAAALRHPFLRSHVLVETDAELRRPLEDVEELPERQVEQREDDGDGVEEGQELITVSLHPRV